jgi:hypothetical protein
MTTHASQSLNGSLDTAIAGSSLNGLGGSGSYALGPAINNTPTDGTTVSYDLGDLTITLSSAVTTGSGAPYITVWVLPAVDGSNYPNPPGSTAGAAPIGLSYSFPQVASASTSTIVCPNLPIPPYNFKIQIQNNLGVALPSTNTSTCQLQRKTVANW